MNIPCKECISFAICLHQINFYQDDEYSFGYVFHWGDLIHRCSYLNILTKKFHGDIELCEVKQFFMREKGIEPIKPVGGKM